MAQRQYFRQIVIRYIMLPQEDDYDAELDWIFQCLGLGGKTDEIARAIFSELVRAAREGKGISSRELMEKLPVTQAAIVYHLNTFMRSGLVVKQGRGYYLRGGSLEHALDEIESDMLRRMGRLKEIARKIDAGRSTTLG
jgi:DNA-binding IclR family transcriptional regulator